MSAADDEAAIDPRVVEDGRAWASEVVQALSAVGLPVPRSVWDIDDERGPALMLAWTSFALPYDLTVWRAYDVHGAVRYVRAFTSSLEEGTVGHGWNDVEPAPAGVVDFVRRIAAVAVG